MKNLVICAATFLVITPKPCFALDPETCKVRGALLGSIARDRDKGISRTIVLKKHKKFPHVKEYVKAVYDDLRASSPQEIALAGEVSCLQE